MENSCEKCGDETLSRLRDFSKFSNEHKVRIVEKCRYVPNLELHEKKVLFAVTGNEFAFKEAPSSMKAVMTAAWLLTEAAGNVIIIIVTRIFVNYQQETQSFIYTGLMFASMALFYFLSRKYQFSEDDVTKECRSNSDVLYHQVKQAEDCLEH